jgi:tetratricopeptide (TPR) repeat protein
MDATQFVESVQPLLACRDVHGLKCMLQSQWTVEQIKGFLTGDNADARKVAALSLALVGGKCCLGPLAQLLRDPDPIVNEMAEHALWSIWFRCGKTHDANHELCLGTKALNHRDFDLAISHLTRAIELDPTFAEAYNQRAIAHYLQERYDESITDCRRAVERMPSHFGAWAGMGHCHAHKGQLAEAVESYERALQINPHLQTVRQGVAELRAELDRQ